jgi:hypothetical protein
MIRQRARVSRQKGGKDEEALVSNAWGDKEYDLANQSESGGRKKTKARKTDEQESTLSIVSIMEVVRLIGSTFDLLRNNIITIMTSSSKPLVSIRTPPRQRLSRTLFFLTGEHSDEILRNTCMYVKQNNQISKQAN